MTSDEHGHISREISVAVDDILSLVNCAADYGFDRDVFYDACAGWLSALTSSEFDEEVEAYVTHYMSPDQVALGYGEEDVESARRSLQEFRSRYMCSRWTPTK